MAKLLIYNKVHWMELPSKSEPTKTGYERNEDIIKAKQISIGDKLTELTALSDKRNRVERRGDIVDIMTPDFTMRGLMLESFVVIAVDGLSDEDARQYNIPLQTGTIDTGLVKHKKRKYNVDISGLNFNKSNEATIQLSTFMSRLTEYKNG